MAPLRSGGASCHEGRARSPVRVVQSSGVRARSHSDRAALRARRGPRGRGLLRGGARVRTSRVRHGVHRDRLRRVRRRARGVRAPLRSGARRRGAAPDRASLDARRGSRRCRVGTAATDRRGRIAGTRIRARPGCGRARHRAGARTVLEPGPSRSTCGPSTAGGRATRAPTTSSAARPRGRRANASICSFGGWCAATASIPADGRPFPRASSSCRSTRTRFALGSACGSRAASSPGWKMAAEITAALRAFDPDDPVRYDFALCHLSMMGACGYAGPRGDADCPLRGWCRTRTRQKAEGGRRK